MKKSLIISENERLRAENVKLRNENNTIMTELQILKSKRNCDNIVLCQNCVNGVKQIETVIFKNGETIPGHVACKLDLKNICENFINK